jgi:threonine/homoserine/homoserine lactone efflux protein
MFLAFLAAAGVLGLLTMAPGPDMAVVTRRSLVGGRGDAFRAASGVVCGLLLWGSLAVLGLTTLLTASPTAYLLVKVVGVCYLVFLGVQAVRGGKHRWLSGYACALDRGRAFFQRPRVRRTVDRLTGMVLIAFAIRLATESS